MASFKTQQANAFRTSPPRSFVRPSVASQAFFGGKKSRCSPSTQDDASKDWSNAAKMLAVAGAVAASISFLPSGALAVSGGGGLGTSLAGKDFSSQDLHSQKFYKADMRQSNFTKANLKGANFFGAFAKDAKFNGADLSNATVESVDFEGADLTDAVLVGVQATNAKFKGTKLDNTDWTDAILRKDVQRQLCAKASGTNPTTGVDTLESLMC